MAAALKLPRIDVHTHILPPDWPDFVQKYGYEGFVKIEKAKLWKDGKMFRAIDANCWSPDVRIKECDETNVTVQVLSTVPVMFNYWAKPEDCLEISKFLNDHIAEICRQRPDRFIGLGTIPLQHPELAVQELQRCMQIGLAGVQIGSHVNDWTLDRKEFHCIFEAAERLNAAIFVHPWDMIGTKLMNKYWLPWLVGMPAETCMAICSMIFGGIFEKFPRLRVCFAHGGGSFPGTLGRIEHGFEVRPDLVAIDNPINPRNYCGRFWLDSLVHDPVALDLVVGTVGANRVVCGSDYPFPLGEAKPGSLIESVSSLTDDQKQRMLWDNALEWLGVDPSTLKVQEPLSDAD